ncbi:MAG: PleD family two-component system response regulator [Stenomitos frigidus ULC029]
MDASILLVGGDDFLATLLVRIRNLVSCTVEVAPSTSEAMPLIQAQQPDLVVLQANHACSLELCHQIKEQTRLAWIYCLLLDHPPSSAEAWHDDAWMMKCQAEALESGADAYLWFPQKDADSETLTSDQSDDAARPSLECSDCFWSAYGEEPSRADANERYFVGDRPFRPAD